MFDGADLYEGLGSGFLERRRRLERQVSLAQSGCRFLWPEDVKEDLLGHHVQGMAERYYHKQLETWWSQLPTLHHAMEKMLEALKTHITPAQSMQLVTRPEDSKKTWTEHYLYLVAVAEVSEGAAEYLVLNNVVQHASEDMRVVLMAKVDAHRTDILQQADELTPFAQA